MSSFDDGASECDGEMGFADAGWPEEDDVFGIRDEAAGSELSNELGVEGRLELEVEVIERFHGRKVRDVDAHGDTLALLRGELFAEDGVDEVEERLVVSCGIGEEGVEPLVSRRQVELAERFGDARTHDRRVRHAAPPITRA